MKAQAIEPTGNLGWIETELDKEYMDYLWMIVKDGKAKGLNHKHALAGNITNYANLLTKKLNILKKD